MLDRQALAEALGTSDMLSLQPQELPLPSLTHTLLLVLLVTHLQPSTDRGTFLRYPSCSDCPRSVDQPASFVLDYY